MRILLLSSTYNSLTQRIHTELIARSYEVSFELALNDEVMREGLALFQPDLIICPCLKQRIPEDIWRRHRCLIIHPGVTGDRGPSSLDWAIQEGESEWGVNILQAAAEMDAGDIWATATFRLRCTSKNSLYAVEVTEAAVKVVLEAIDRVLNPGFTPEPLSYGRPDVRGRLRPMMKQVDRRIDWKSDSVAIILRRINAADGSPGLLDTIEEEAFYLYGACAESALHGEPGELIARRHGAICRAAVDGSVWISHLRRKDTKSEQRHFKLPAVMALGERVERLPHAPLPVLASRDASTHQEIWYTENKAIGYLHFDFYNGAMSTDQCLRLWEAVLEARRRPIKILVLLGGIVTWSNGIHLNVIEASENPADESWRNINAINDLVYAILTTESQLTIAAVHSNAGAGGVSLALACDKIYARAGIVFNPHYRTMGLYGSEYWTYLLPKRVGYDKAFEITASCRAIGTLEAKAIGLIEGIIPGCLCDFEAQIGALAEHLAYSPNYERMLSEKRATRHHDEAIKPLTAYRQEELERMWKNFYGADSVYHLARKHFVFKTIPLETPLRLAQHRRAEV